MFRRKQTCSWKFLQINHHQQKSYVCSLSPATSTNRILGYGSGALAMVLDACTCDPTAAVTLVIDDSSTSHESPLAIPESKSCRITLQRMEFTRFRAKPLFDLLIFGPELFFCSQARQRQLFQYGRMLLHPGGVCRVDFVFPLIHAKKKQHIPLNEDSVNAVMIEAGYYPVRRYCRSFFNSDSYILGWRPLFFR